MYKDVWLKKIIHNGGGTFESRQLSEKGVDDILNDNLIEAMWWYIVGMTQFFIKLYIAF